MEISFSNWLRDKLAAHQMTQAELSRRSGITTAQISRIISEARGIGSSAANAIAIALDLPAEEVHRAAGLLPPQPREDPLVNVITYLAEKLPTKEDKQDAEQYLRLRLRIAEERGKHESIDKKRSEKT
jgi:transcriptional regulator with XRE-family HTH domain